MTNPPADVAKLLPCPFCGVSHGVHLEALNRFVVVARCSNCNATHCEKTEAEAVAKWNTRPQPAPPAGEPVAWAVKDFADGWIIFDSEVEAKQVSSATGALMVRLGLAARPKVEDAEVVRLIGFLRSKWHGATLSQTNEELMAQAADLLKRLAGELSDALDHHRVLDSCLKAQHELTKAAEAKLAEREAELAKADAVIAEYVADDVIFDAEKEPTMKSLDNQREAQRRHAARQQQKASGEPTAKEGE